MSSDILDSSLRLFISKGTGIDSSKVIKGLRSDESPGGLFASLFLMNQRPMGINNSYQYIGASQSFTIDDNVWVSTYSVQFYREGAIDAATRFVEWARSETGRNWASSALTDGRIKAAIVYAGGSGYEDGATVNFITAAGTPASDIPTSAAVGEAVVNDRGQLVRVIITNFGAGYYDIPTADVGGEGTGAQISPIGFGFRVMDPISIRNITFEINDEYQERAQIDMKVCHNRVYIDRDSGRVEQILED